MWPTTPLARVGYSHPLTVMDDGVMTHKVLVVPVLFPWAPVWGGTASSNVALWSPISGTGSSVLRVPFLHLLPFTVD